MPELLALSVGEFVAVTAARQPTPGGGSIAALCGALAAALGGMALEYTAGKKAFAAHETEIRGTLAQFTRARAMLLELMVEDVAAYETLSALLKLPELERLAHPQYAAAVAAAIRVPQATAGFALNVLEHCAAMKDKTNKMLVSDLAIAAVYAHATVQASELNVRVNLPLLTDENERQQIAAAMAGLTEKAARTFAPLHQAILAGL